MLMACQPLLTLPTTIFYICPMKTLPLLLKEWRDGKKFTQADAARHCDISAQLWFLLEKGQRDPRRRTLVKLAAGTGIPLNELAEVPTGAVVVEAQS